MYKIIKWIIDRVLALIGIVVLLPVMVVLMVIIKATSPGPVFFKQQRVGQYDRLFTIYKFRTMRVDTPNLPTHLLENPDQYITSIGKFMRKTSLDELPQLFNIFKADMSIVGPRPSLPSQVDLNQLRQKNHSNKLKPGLTGLAQVSGRDELPIEVKANYDGTYYRTMSFLFDVKLFFRTFTSVLKAEGVQEGKVKDGNTLATKKQGNGENLL